MCFSHANFPDWRKWLEQGTEKRKKTITVCFIDVHLSLFLCGDTDFCQLFCFFCFFFLKKQQQQSHQFVLITVPYIFGYEHSRQAKLSSLSIRTGSNAKKQKTKRRAWFCRSQLACYTETFSICMKT